MRSARRFPSSGALFLVAATVLAAALGSAPAANAQPNLSMSPELEAGEPQEPTPAFARVRYGEGPLRVIREAGYEEEAATNEPVYAGDEVLTNAGQRAELQLPDGTLVRLDGASRLSVYDVGEPGGTDRSILGLARGTVQAEVAAARGGDAFRLDTPSASIYPLEPSSVRVDIERGEEVLVTVARGRVEVAGADGSVLVTTGERTRVRPGRSPLSPWDYLLASRDGFDRWIAQRDDAYGLRQRPGEEYAELPEPVRPYYGELRENGEWVYTEPYGWVWNPDVEDDWRPYARGSWYPGPHGPVWIGPEPWSWPVYRYGRWDWRASIGWVWIPGRVFSSAHVVWYYGPDYVGWCPIGYYDVPVHVSIGFGWGHRWFDHHPWVFVGYDHFYYHRHVVRGHASRVRPSWNRGVVTRRAVHVRPHEVGAHGRRHGSGASRKAAAVLRERARRLDGDGRAAVTRVRELDARSRGGAAASARRVPFSEREREVLERRAGSTRTTRGVPRSEGEIRAPGRSEGSRSGRSGVIRGSSPSARERDRGGSAGRTRGAGPRGGSSSRGSSGRSDSGARKRKSPQVSIRPGARDGGGAVGEAARTGSAKVNRERSSARRSSEERVRRFFRQLEDTRRPSRPRTGDVKGAPPSSRGTPRYRPSPSKPSSNPRYRPSPERQRSAPRYGPSRSTPKRPSAGSSPRRAPSRPKAAPSRSKPPKRVAPSRGGGSRSEAGSSSRRSAGPSRSSRGARGSSKGSSARSRSSGSKGGSARKARKRGD